MKEKIKEAMEQERKARKEYRAYEQKIYELYESIMEEIMDKNVHEYGYTKGDISKKVFGREEITKKQEKILDKCKDRFRKNVDSTLICTNDRKYGFSNDVEDHKKRCHRSTHVAIGNIKSQRDYASAVRNKYGFDLSREILDAKTKVLLSLE